MQIQYSILINVKKQGNNHSSTAIVNIDHISSYASVAMWSFLKSRLEKHFPNSNGVLKKKDELSKVKIISI